MKKLFGALLAAFAIVLIIPGCSGQSKPDIPVQDILVQIQTLYGDDYLPNMDIPADLLEAEFGLTGDMYVDAVGEMPMMSTQADRVVIVRAAQGQGDAVETALKAARDNKINAELQYPANMIKTKTAKVVRNGDYLAFLLVGTPLDDFDASEQDLLTHYEAEVQKGVDTFHGFFG